MRVAAIQLEARLADVGENLRRSEQLADEAGRRGAEWIILPEFFTTGMGYVAELVSTALPSDGPGLALLRAIARRYHAVTGGSFICRDRDGHNRNVFYLVGRTGHVLGRHAKDLPTMWENAFYVGGDDDGRISIGSADVGVALCWEFMRAQTAERLRERVDIVVGGSAWWSVPAFPPRALAARMEARNERNAATAPAALARYVGAPVIHAAHCGRLACPSPGFVPPYRGRFEGGTGVFAADGSALARRGKRDGPGVVIAELKLGREPARDAVPARFWLHRRGAVPAWAWWSQRRHGRRWYARHAWGRPVWTSAGRSEETSQAPPVRAPA